MPNEIIASMKYFQLLAIGLFALTGCSSRKSPWTIIAHRSAPGYLPEHTLAGVAMAASWNVDFIEPDVVLTKDNVPIVMHDILLDNSTDVSQKFAHKRRRDGHFYAIDLTLEEIKKLHVLERGKGDPKDTAVFPSRFPRNLARTAFQIPTFKEYLEMIEGLRKTTGYKLGVYPEIKKPAFHESQGKNIVKIVYQEIKSFGYEDKPDLIYLQCFDPKALKMLKFEIKTKIPLIQLIGKNEWQEADVDFETLKNKDGLKEISEYAVGIGPSIDDLYALDPESEKPIVTSLANFAHQNGLMVHPYTHRPDSLPLGFKTEEQLLSFLMKEAKVDGIFSDFANRIIHWIPASSSKEEHEQFRHKDLL